MSMRKFFSRKKESEEVNEIVCDSSELKELITSWTRNEGWDFKNFVDFIKLIGEDTPVRLCELKKESKSFKCITAGGKEIYISLYFGDYEDFFSEIIVNENEETRRYIINTNSKEEERLPQVTLLSKSIKKSGKELECVYYDEDISSILKYDDSYELTIMIDDVHMLKITISKFNKHSKEEKSTVPNWKGIEEYLLALDGSLVVTEVYKKLMKLFHFSSDDISGLKTIYISYVEFMDKEERNLQKIKKSYGETQEYVINDNGGTYYVFRGGNWKYISNNGIKIEYYKEKKKYEIFIASSKEEIIKMNMMEVLKKVEEKISELCKFVE